MSKIERIEDSRPGRTFIYVFECPGCKYQHPFDDRWGFNEDYEKPTFHPSLLVHESRYSPRCHSFVRDGKIEFLSDCGHELAGQTVELPEREQLYTK